MSAGVYFSVWLPVTDCSALNSQCIKSVMKRVSCGRKSKWIIILCYREKEIFNQGRKYTIFGIHNTFDPATAESNIHACTWTPTYFPESGLLGVSVLRLFFSLLDHSVVQNKFS